jgi:hypothetical protein
VSRGRIRRPFPGGICQEQKEKENPGPYPAAAERRLEFFEREKNFAIVLSGVFARLDVNRANFAAILTSS